MENVSHCQRTVLAAPKTVIMQVCSRGKHEGRQFQVVFDHCLRQGICSIVKVGVDIQLCSEEYWYMDTESFVNCLMGETFGGISLKILQCHSHTLRSDIL